ncbi:MAG: bile acid:sodium symporter [SAR324 cluster bacterium]|nr:bile acid:sodium symporter [SAR324 cluster bacterium]
MDFFKTNVLPLGLIIAIVVALLIPNPGIYLKQHGLVPWMVISIFLIYGYQTKYKEIPWNLSFLKTFVFAFFTNLLVAPFLGLGLAHLFQLSSAMTLGLIVASVVPPTLSSGVVLTEVAGGNTRWALMMTIGLNIIGVFTIPFILPLCLKVDDEIIVSAFPLLQDLVLYVLAPLLVGNQARRFFQEKQEPSAIKQIPPACVILIVWISMSASSEILMTLDIPSLLKILAAAFFAHLLLLLGNASGGLFLKLKNKEKKALLFVASQKTLPVAISILTVINAAEATAALLVCIVYHFMQLLMDSVIASRSIA